MPLEDMAEGFIRIIGRFLFHILTDIKFELLIKGPGYIICNLRLLRKMARGSRMNPLSSYLAFSSGLCLQ